MSPAGSGDCTVRMWRLDSERGDRVLLGHRRAPRPPLRSAQPLRFCHAASRLPCRFTAQRRSAPHCKRDRPPPSRCSQRLDGCSPPFLGADDSAFVLRPRTPTPPFPPAADPHTDTCAAMAPRHRLVLQCLCSIDRSISLLTCDTRCAAGGRCARLRARTVAAAACSSRHLQTAPSACGLRTAFAEPFFLAMRMK